MSCRGFCTYLVVTISPVWIVQSRDIQQAASNDPIIAHHDPRKGPHDNGVGRHELQQARRSVVDFPRHHTPRAHNGSKHDGPANVEVAWKQCCHVVGEADAVGRDVIADLSDEPDQGAEEACSTPTGRRAPRINNLERVPNVFSVDVDRGAGADDAEQRREGFDKGDEWQLVPLRRCCLAEAGEVGYIDGNG